MKRPDGCTCGRGMADGSHLPGCTVVPMVKPETSPLAALTVALDDWYEFRGPNPNAALRSAVTVFLDDCRRRTGRWETPGQVLGRWAAIGEAVERLRAVLPEGWGASLNMTQGDDGHPYSVSIWNERVEDIDPLPSWCESVPDAVAEAIGEGGDLADPREWRN